jgi:hypothetical protein
MTQNSAAPERKSGQSDNDKRQADLTKQDRGQGVARDERGQDQPADRQRAQQTSGLKAQKDAAQTQPQSPGQPAGGE